MESWPLLRCTCRTASLALLVLALFMVMGRVRAQDVGITWRAPGDCPSEAAVREQVVRALKGRVEGLAALHATAHVTRLANGRYRLELEIVQAERRAQRHLTAHSCSALAQTTGVLVAMALDPAAQSAESLDVQNEQQPSEPPPDTRAAAAEPSARVDGERGPTTPTQPNNEADEARRTRASQRLEVTSAERPSVRTERPIRPLAGAFLGVAGLGLPAAQTLVGGLVGLSVARLELALALSGLLPREQVVVPGVEVRLSTMQLGLEARALWGQALRVGPYVALNGLWTRASGEGLANARQRALFWMGANVGLSARWQFSERFGLTLDGAVGLPLSARPHFDISGTERAVEAGRWHGFGRIGLHWSRR